MRRTSLRCGEVRNALVTRAVAGGGAAPDPEVTRHLETCGACARFADGVHFAPRLLVDGPTASPGLRGRALDAALAARAADRAPTVLLTGAAAVALAGALVPVAVAARLLVPWTGSIPAAWATALALAGLVGTSLAAACAVLLLVLRGGAAGSGLVRREV